MFNRKPFKASELLFAPVKLSAYAIAQERKQHDTLTQATELSRNTYHFIP